MFSPRLGKLKSLDIYQKKKLKSLDEHGKKNGYLYLYQSDNSQMPRGVGLREVCRFS